MWYHNYGLVAGAGGTPLQLPTLQGLPEVSGNCHQSSGDLQQAILKGLTGPPQLNDIMKGCEILSPGIASFRIDLNLYKSQTLTPSPSWAWHKLPWDAQPQSLHYSTYLPPTACPPKKTFTYGGSLWISTGIIPYEKWFPKWIRARISL